MINLYIYIYIEYLYNIWYSKEKIFLKKLKFLILISKNVIYLKKKHNKIIFRHAFIHAL